MPCTTKISTIRVSSHKWHIDFQLNIQKKSHSSLKNLGIYVSFPSSISLRQNLISLQSSHPVSEVTDILGNSWLSVQAPETFEDFQFSYYAILETYPIYYTWNIVEEKYPQGWPQRKERYLQSEPGVECSSPEVLFLAEKIKEKSSAQIIQKAFRVVKKNLVYKLQKKEYGAQYAALHGEGDCTEYASLFAAILRAHNLPARITIGYLGDETLHAITEVYVGGVWIPMDITNDLNPTLGIRKDFITLMRANWMSKRNVEKLVSFYYRSFSTPKINSSSQVKSLPYRHGIVLNTLPYFIKIKRNSRSFLQSNIEEKEDCFQITLENLANWNSYATILIVFQHKIIQTFPVYLDEKATGVVNVEKKNIYTYRKKNIVEIFLLDEVEYLKKLYTIPKTEVVQIL